MPITIIGKNELIYYKQPPYESISSMTATLTGPTTGTQYKTLVYTIAQSSTYTGIITPSDNGAGGIFDPVQLQWTGTSQSQTFNYIPNKATSISISISANKNVTISGSPVSLVTTQNIAQSIIFTAPSLGNNGDIDAIVGTPTGNFTVTPNGLLTGTVYPWDGGQGGSFNPSSLTFVNSSTPQTFTYTPVAAIKKVKIYLFVPLGFNPVNQYTVAVQPATATSATLSWTTSTVKAGIQAPTVFTLTLNGGYTGVLTLSDGSQGGTFFPSNKINIVNPSNAPVYFYYTPKNTFSGSVSISISASPSLTIAGSPQTVTVLAATPILAFGPNVNNPFYAPNASNS